MTLAVLSQLFLSVNALNKAKAYKYFTKSKRFSDGTILWSMEKGLFLRIDPQNEVVNYVSSEGENRTDSVDLDDLFIVTEAINGFNDLCQARNHTPLKYRLRAPFSNFSVWLRNTFKIGPHIYKGQFHTEEDFTFQAALKHTARKIIWAGNETMKLVRSRIIDGHIFYCLGDDSYLVYRPDAPDGVSDFYESKTLSIEDIKPLMGIARSTELNLLNSMKLWTREVGL